MKVEIDGVETEVFTEAEIAAQKEAAIEEYKVANPDKSAEIEKLQADLKTATEAVSGLKDKDFNFGKLRETVATLETQLTTKVEAAKKEILDGVMLDHFNDTVKVLAGDDVELKKKIEFQYKRLGDATGTKEEVTKKLTDAWVLATKKEDDGAFNTTVLSSGGVGRLNVGSDKKFTPEEKAFAQKLAQSGGIKLEDKDFK